MNASDVDGAGDQTTTYAYGTTLADSGVARNDLLVSTTYPDSVGGSDVVSYTYNRLGQQLTVTDQRGTVRTLYYDLLGRLTNDCVTTNGTGTDVGTKQIATAYEVRGMVNLITSTDSATPGSGTVLNQVAKSYNDFGQLIEEQQDHGGAVSGSSPGVQYGYDSGASGSNEIRQSTLIYPNGRVITYSYGTSGGMSDYLNRVDTIQDTTSGTTDLASYLYLGAATVIRITYPQPSVWLDLWGGASGTFNGFDRFGRITDQRWQNAVTTTPVDIDRYQYGYDQNSNRLWKANVVSASASVYLDEAYQYDHLNRLTQMQRGTLSGGVIIGTPSIEQDWTLDPTGNWSQFATLASGNATMTQGRVSNTVNEITNITSVAPPPPPSGTPTPTAWVTPAYDAAGNMTTMPQPATPTSAFTAAYDAWNRMTSITDASTSDLVGQYQYDGRNFRIVKKTYTGGTLTETRRFYFTSGWQDIEERVGTSTSMDQQHVWGVRYIDELLCRDDARPLRLYASQDANFNVTALVDVTGTVQQRFVYEPYGMDTVYNGSWSVTSDTFCWADRFMGRHSDFETGLYAYRTRSYHLELGCFLEWNHWGYIQRRWNLYDFCTNDPVRFVEPYSAVEAPPDVAEPPPMKMGPYPPDEPSAGTGASGSATPPELLVNPIMGTPQQMPPSSPPPSSSSYPPLPPGYMYDPAPRMFPRGAFIPSPPVIPVPGGKYSPPNTGDCTRAELDVLSAAVTKECKTGKRSCDDQGLCCDEIAKRWAMNGRCANARTQREFKCFAGGDSNHQQQYIDAWEAQGKCAAAFWKRKCSGILSVEALK